MLQIFYLIHVCPNFELLFIPLYFKFLYLFVLCILSVSCVCVCVYVCVCAQSLYLWLTLCDLMVHGIFLARTLEWVAISSFRVSSQPRD